MMIHSPWLIVVVLIALEILILSLAAHPRTKHLFNFLPHVFWIYFLPMLASTFGIIDAKSPVYSFVTTNLLPASLFLLLLAVDVKAIARLGRPALLMMFMGSVGISLGTVISFWIFKRWVGPEFWSGFGALSASWTGGSANMVAVKEAMKTPDNIFLPMVIVDAIVPYVWMGILVAMVSLQPAFDRWNKSERKVLDELQKRMKGLAQVAVKKMTWLTIGGLFILALIGGKIASTAAAFLPEIKNIFSMYAWTIIIVSFLGIACSLTKIRRLEEYGSTKVGYWLLYFVLTCIGAKASIANIGATAVLILAGFVIVIVHVVVLMTAARIFKTPMFLVVTASQANIGGVASAPVVAEIYQPGFASVGLLLAILGNIVGTYIGILNAQVCRWLAGF